MLNLTKEFAKKYKGKTVYLSNDFERAVVKMTPNDGNFVKFKGENEFQAKTGSGVVTETYLAGKIISKKEYDNF